MATPKEYFLFCPHCGKRYPRDVPSGGQHQSCPACGVTVYHNPHPAVALIVLNEHDEVLLARRGIEPSKGKWDTPGGFLDWGEDWIAAAIREFLEEGKVRFTPAGILGAYHCWYEVDGLTISTVTMYVFGTIDGEPVPDSDVVEFRYFPLRHLPTDLAFPHIREAFADLRHQFEPDDFD